MLSIEERLAILDSAEHLNSTRDYHALVRLLSDRSHNELFAEPALAFLLATAWHFIGRDEDALRLALEVQVRCEAGGESRVLLRCRNLLGSLYVEKGNLHEAEATFRSVLSASVSRGDETLAAASTYNLGVIDNIRCNWSEALAAYERAATMFYSAGLDAWIGLSRHNIAMLYRQMGRYEEADSQFERALEFAVARGQEEDTAFAEIERALLQSLMGDIPLAIRGATRGLKKARALANRTMEGEALRVLGAIANRSRQWTSAKAYLVPALEISRRTSRRLLEAEVLEEIAIMNAGIGNNALARSALNAAKEIYRSMGADAHIGRLGKLL